MRTRTRPARYLGVLLTLSLLLTMTPIPVLGNGGHAPEPNDFPAGAQVLSPPSQTVTETIDWGGSEAWWDYPTMDWDYYAIEAEAGQTYTWWLEDAFDTSPWWGMFANPYANEDFEVYGYSTPFTFTASSDSTISFVVTSDYAGQYVLKLAGTEETGTISGAVKDENTGEPLVGIYVTARFEGDYVGATTSAADGSFTLGGLVSGGYHQLGFTDPTGEYLPEFWQDAETPWDSTLVEAGASVSIGWAELAREATISGTVYNPKGEPLPGAMVSVMIRDEGRIGLKELPDMVLAGQVGGLGSIMTTETGGDGSFEFGGLRANDYSLLAIRDPYLRTYYGDVWSADEAVLFAVGSGEHATGKDIHMLGPSTIAGAVKNSLGDSLAGTYLQLYRWIERGERFLRSGDDVVRKEPANGFQLVGIEVGPDEGRWEWWSETNADEDGLYSFSDLRPGEYAVLASAVGYAQQSWSGNPHDPYAADRIAVSTDETLTADFVMTGGGSIAGTITLDGELGLAKASVYWQQDGTWVGVGDGWTDPDGLYWITGLVPGTYRVGFWAPDYAPEFYDDVAAIMDGTDVVVVDDEVTSGISADLGHGRSIQGRVTSSDGTGLWEVRVDALYLDAPQRQYETIVQPEWVSAASVWTDSLGDYELTGLSPDRTYVVAFNKDGSSGFNSRTRAATGVWGGSYCPEYHDDLPHFDGAAPYWERVAVGSGIPTPTIDATMTQSNSVWGTVRDCQENALDGIVVKLYYNVPGAGWTLMDTQYSGDAEGPGSYYFSPVKSGEWKVMAYDPSGKYGSATSDPVSATEDEWLQVDLEMECRDRGSVAGKDRYGTSVAVSRSTYLPGEADTVVLASGVSWPDTLGGAALGSALNGPVLLTRPTDLPGEVRAEIVRLGVDNVIIVGGRAAVSRAVFTAVDSIPGVDAERIAGRDRFETSAKVARRVASALGGAWHGTAIMATGENYPDAMSASPLSSGQTIPVLLTRSDVVPGVTMAAVSDLGIDEVILLGDQLAVSGHVKKQLEKYAVVTRLGGTNRFHTSALIAQHAVNTYGHDWNRVGFASGNSYPDALVAGVMQGRDNSVLMLTATNYLPSAPKAMLIVNRDDIDTVRFFGGPTAVSPAVRAQIQAIVE